MDTPEERINKENVHMSQKPRRKFTAEQKAEAVHIVEESDKPISRVAKEMGLTESALRNWVKQSKIDCQQSSQGPLTSIKREKLNTLRRELKRVQMERDFLKKAATFFALM
ncbi:MAG: transposase [Elainellaceae cyanobacterium]